MRGTVSPLSIEPGRTGSKGMRTRHAESVALRAARPDDLPKALALLEAAGLPVAGVAAGFSRFIVAESNGRLVGVAGLEVYGTDGLLRSVAVDGAWRGRGLGAALTDAVLRAAQAEGIADVYLLTESADAFFARRGFRRISREDVSEAVKGSAEFGELCPLSSAVMVRCLATET